MISHTERRNRGISIIDVLVATVILAVALVPVVSMGSRGVQRVSIDRVSVDAEALCHDALERFGRAQDNVCAYLSAPDDRGVRSAANPWERFPEIYSELGAERVARLVASHGLELTLTLTPGEGGLDRLSCTVTYTTGTYTTGAGKDLKNRRVEYSRFILQEMVEPWS